MSGHGSPVTPNALINVCVRKGLEDAVCRYKVQLINKWLAEIIYKTERPLQISHWVFHTQSSAWTWTMTKFSQTCPPFFLTEEQSMRTQRLLYHFGIVETAIFERKGLSSDKLQFAWVGTLSCVARLGPCESRVPFYFTLMYFLFSPIASGEGFDTSSLGMRSGKQREGNRDA